MRRRVPRLAAPLPAWILSAWMSSAWTLSVLVLMAGCSDGPCPPWSGGQVPSGRFEPSRQLWIAGLQAQVLEVDREAETATVEFDDNGVRYRATYRLRQMGRAVQHGTWVTIAGVLQPDDCEAAFAQSAVLDAVLLKRGGKVIARAAQQKLEGGCQDAVKPEQVLGDPDGKGVSLAGATVRVRFERYVLIEPDDEIEVHATGGYYEVRISGFSESGGTYEHRIGGGRGTLGWRVYEQWGSRVRPVASAPSDRSTGVPGTRRSCPVSLEAAFRPSSLSPVGAESCATATCPRNASAGCRAAAGARRRR